MTSLKLNYVALTDVGLRRSTNQDSGYASSRLIAVADGMGGAAAGDLASSEAMNVVRQLDRDLGDIDSLEAMQKAVAHANERLGELVRDDPSVEGMGTTLEAMLWNGKRFATAHIGDSRAYLMRDGELEQISTDHTFVQSLVEEGKLTLEEARTHPHRSLLLRVMLGRDDNEADFDWFEGRLGDRFLLCSDGLSDMVDDDVIAEHLREDDSIDLAAAELVRLALENGGHDNVTVVIGELVDASSDPDEHLSSSDGRPQLVGAAAEGPRPRTGQNAGGSGPTKQPDRELVDADLDPEELRYAPRPPGRWLWLRRALAVVVVLAVAAGGGWFAYQWSQDQYFVAVADDRVAIYRGLQADVPFVTLRHVDEITDVELEALPAYRAQQVRQGIEASSRVDAEQIVADLERFAQPDEEPADEPADGSADEGTAP